MNNLLRTLTEAQTRNATGTDLKLLLTTVKEGRRQGNDPKLSDPFYDSLEGLLLDLRTVTIDNHDAEAFLKPVVKTEYPDYYDYIHNPMDLQTMMKRVKQKHYKSKREFKDDLDLIWSNCRTYNAAENHPLRHCVRRLQIKAEKLLENITDRKERTDPIIPFASPAGEPLTNGKSKHGMVNGTSYRSSPSTRSTVTQDSLRSMKKSGKLAAKASSFADSPAILRTQEGMAMFQQLDAEVAGQSDELDLALAGRLKDLSAPHWAIEERNESGESTPTDAPVGEKRKLNGNSEPARKRQRFLPSPSPFDPSEITTLWWGAVQSDSLLGNGLPHISHASSSKRRRHPFTVPAPQPQATTSTAPADPTSKPDKPPQKLKRKKKSVTEYPPPPPKALLTMMNSNINTMRRVRRTHTKYSALNVNASGPSNEDDADAAIPPPPPPPAYPRGGAASGSNDDDMVTSALEDDKVDERPWKIKRSGIEIGGKNADDCLGWANSKVLEHAGFQGTSSMALGVMNGILGEYLMNVGRTIHFLCEKHAHTMTTEEIVLHTLFESGISKIQDLEQFIVDDVERYGARLGDLEKKIIGAYREATITDIIDDDDLFEENEGEEGAFVLGGFADAIGDDFLGLRELGIAAEFGMTNLSIPKRLLKGKKDRGQAAAAAKATEPPLPYPLPPPLIPLTSAKLDSQIGLLRPYYANRLAALQPPPPPPPITSPLPPYQPPPGPLDALPPGGPTLSDLPNLPQFPPLPPPTLLPAVITLPDDAPIPSRTKMGPLGQINKPVGHNTSATAANASKKKATPAKALAAVAHAPSMTPSSSMTNGMTGIEEGTTPTSQSLAGPGEIQTPIAPTPTKKKKASGGNAGMKKKGPSGNGPDQNPTIPPYPIVSARA